MTNYRDNFNEGKTTKISSYKNYNQRGIPFTGSANIAPEIESDRFMLAYKQQMARYLPSIDHRNPSQFCQFGSAERYYTDSFNRIIETYPYDGSRAEKLEWSLSSSVVDLYLLEHEYPKSTGHIDFGKDHTIVGTFGNAPGTVYSKVQSPKYIKFSGGPHKGTIYNKSKNRESNLKIDGEKGNTVEFWMKKDPGTWRSSYNKEIILDMASNAAATDFSGYGRMAIELETAANPAHSPIRIQHLSGTIGTPNSFNTRGIRLGDSSVTMDTVADGQWHHYAITMKTVDTSTVYKLYIDGTLNYTTTESWTIGPINQFINGTIGASKGGSSTSNNPGEGTLQAALDEFRFWKVARTEKEIGKNWYRSIHGGTDNDHSNADLGLYYKFNEGITNSDNLDKIVLDYSGRINNGTIVNYNSSMRSLESAINQSQYLPTNDKDFIEDGDPIIIDGNPLIEEKLETLKKIGKEYDFRNSNSLFYSVPQFMRDQDEEFFPELLQIMASVLDDLYLKILHLPKLKDYYYEDFFTARGSARNLEVNSFIFGCDSDEEYKVSGAKTRPWIESTLQHFGFTVPEIFQEATIQEYFNQASDHLTFDQKLSEVKNIILSNIHKNLVHIYNTKGTEKSFRNMLRCFGVDTDLVKFNVYTENESREVINDIAFETIKQKSLNFTNVLNSAATVYGTTFDGTDSREYITGSNFESAYTMESNIILPSTQISPDILKSSLFGLKTTDGSKDFDAQASGSFEVFCVRPSSARKDAYFLLTSSNHTFQEITSSTFTDTYNNEHWNVSVRISRGSDLESSLIPAGGSEQYKVEFSGYNYDLDLLQASFNLTSSITKTKYDLFNNANKYAYLGAEREHVSGAVLNRSNVRMLGSAFWLDRLTKEELKIHAQNSNYFGRSNPTEISKYNSGQNILTADTSVFRWQFENLSESNASGQMIINDMSSGSLERANSMNGGSIIGYQHPALGINFGTVSASITQEFLPFVKISPIGNRYSSKDVNIINTEIDKFKADSRPVSKKFTFEKSMYQIMSEKMLDFFSGITGFNTLVGATVNKYRQDYKALKVLRERFFSKVENTIDLDKFVEYYRWIDDSISQALAQLLPASANINDNLRNSVESHMLERNKYQHPAPTLEFKTKEDIHPILGINELTYNWKLGHAPLSLNRPEDINSTDGCLWRNQREEVSPERFKIRDAAITEVSGSTYVRKALVKPYKFGVDIVEIKTKNEISSEFYKSLNSNRSIEVRPEDIINRKKKCVDPLPSKVDYDVITRVEGQLIDSDISMPFSFLSKSDSSFADFGSLKTGLQIVNLETKDRSVLQGPFARQHEGLMPHEAVPIVQSGSGPNLIDGVKTNRPEAYNLEYSAQALTMSAVDTVNSVGPRSLLRRSTGIATPYVVRNIKNDRETGFLGNYDKSYDIVQIHGKSSNNKDLRQLNFTVNYIPSDYIAGISDFARPTGSGQDHVFVSRFASPGGPEVGGSFARDPEAGEYSIYSTVNHRNELIRDVYNDLSAEYSEQFGYRSGSSAVGSIHKTNRNPTRIITEASNDLQYDNYFKQREIPSNDFGYAWITASANEGVYSFLKANANFGHQQNFYPGFHLLNDSSSALYFDDGGSNNPYVQIPQDSSWTLSSVTNKTGIFVAAISNAQQSNGSIVIPDNDAFSFIASGSATAVSAVANYTDHTFLQALDIGTQIAEREDKVDQLGLAHSGAFNQTITDTTWPNKHTIQYGHLYDAATITTRYDDSTDYFAIGTQSNTTFNGQYFEFPGGDMNNTTDYPATHLTKPAFHAPFMYAGLLGDPDYDEHLSFVKSNGDECSFGIGWWMRAHTKSENRSIMGKWSANSEYYIAQKSRNIKLVLYDNTNSQFASYEATNILSAAGSVWEHIVITYDVSDNKVKFYRNGALHTTHNRNSSWEAGTYKMRHILLTEFQIGRVNTPTDSLSSHPFDGDISNVVIFKHDGQRPGSRSSDGTCPHRSTKALTLTDVKMLYNNGRIYNYSYHSKYIDMVCWWPLGSPSNTAPHANLFRFDNHGFTGTDPYPRLFDGRSIRFHDFGHTYYINSSPSLDSTGNEYGFNQVKYRVENTAHQHVYPIDNVLKGPLEFESRAFAVAFWMKKETGDTGGVDKIIISKDRLWRISQNDRTLKFHIRDSSYDIEANDDDGIELEFATGPNFLHAGGWEFVVIEFFFDPVSNHYKTKFSLPVSFTTFTSLVSESALIDSNIAPRNIFAPRPSFSRFTGNGNYGSTYGFGFNGHPNIDSWNGILSNVALFIRPNNTDVFTDAQVRELYNNAYVFDWRRFSVASDLVSYVKLNKVPDYGHHNLRENSSTSNDRYDYIRKVDASSNNAATSTGTTPYLVYKHFEDRRFIMSCWIRFHDLSDRQHIISKSNTHIDFASHKQYELRKDANNKLVLQLHDSRPLSRAVTGSLTFTGSLISNANQWYHIAITYDPGAPQLESHAKTGFATEPFENGYNNRAKFYLNGVLTDTVAPSETVLDYVSMVPASQHIDPGMSYVVFGGTSGKSVNKPSPGIHTLKASLAEVLVVTGNIDNSYLFDSGDVTELYNHGFVWDQRGYKLFESASYYYKLNTSTPTAPYQDSVLKSSATPTAARATRHMSFLSSTPGMSLFGQASQFGRTNVDGLQSRALVDTNFAFSVWMQKLSNQPSKEAIISKFSGGSLDAPSGLPEFVLYREAQDIYLRLYDLTGLHGRLAYREASVNNFFSSNINEWEHVTVVRDKDNDKVIFYKNAGQGGNHGGSKTEVSIAYDPTVSQYEEMQNTTTNVTIGNLFENNAGNDGVFYFDGRLSNFLIFKQTLAQSALTDNDVANLYNNGLVFDYSTHPRAAELSAWYKFEDEAAQIMTPGRTDFTALEQISSITGTYSGIDTGTMTDEIGTPLAAERAVDKDFSITFRMKTANTAKQYFVGKVSASGKVEYTGYIEGNQIVFRFNEDVVGGSKTFTANIAPQFVNICDDQWHHIAILYFNVPDTMQVYVDGIIQVSGITDSEGNASYSAMTQQRSNLFIGNAFASGYNSFSGSLADFAIYKHDGQEGRSIRPPTAAEVSSSYNHGYRTNLNNHPKADDMVGYWKLGGHLDETSNSRGIKHYGLNRGLINFPTKIRFDDMHGNAFRIKVPQSAGGSGLDVTVVVTDTLEASTNSGRLNTSLPDNTIQLKVPTVHSTAFDNKMELKQNFKHAVNGTGIDDDSAFIVGSNLVDGIAGIIAKDSSSGLALGVDIQSNSRHISAQNIEFENISTGSYVQSPIDSVPDLDLLRFSSLAINDVELQGPAGLTPNKKLRPHSSQTIPFLERSQQDTSFGFSPNNRIISPIIDEVTNTLVFENTSSLPADLNSILLSRQGPYGWPTWKQLRGSQHPISRHMRKNSSISFVTIGEDNVISSMEVPTQPRYIFDPHPNDYISTDVEIPQERVRKVKNYTEPFVLQSYNPVAINFYESVQFPGDNSQLLRHKAFQDIFNNLPADEPLLGNLEFDFKDDQERQESLWSYDASLREFSNTRQDLSFGMIKTSYENDLVKFSNKDVVNVLGLTNKTKHQTNVFIKDIVREYDKLIQFSFKQDIFPKSENTFLAKTRMRQLFDFPWNRTRTQREIVLTGSLSITNPPSLNGYYIYPRLEKATLNNTRDLNSMGIDLTGHISYAEQDVQSTKNSITSSVWPLDARKNFNETPQAFRGYFSNAQISIRGKEGEGELQNDYNIYHEGLNSIFTIAPPAMSYNRRVPQDLTTINTTVLSGDAKWLAANQIGSYPYRDSYGEDTKEIKAIAKQFSIAPEFKISDFVEKVITGDEDFLQIGKDGESSDFLTLTGSSASDFSGIVKDYSTSDMMESFGLVLEHNNDDITPIKITLRCDAAIKFVPYEGFYPAERVLQLGRLFSNNYLSHLGFRNTDSTTIFGTHNVSAFNAKKIANLQQVSKVLFSPGILLNSIKSGVAVDYPIFNRLEGHATGSYDENENPLGLLNRLLPPLTGSGPYVNAEYIKTNSNHQAFAHTQIVGVTGSYVYLNEDSGIPRISGSVSSRVTFEDLLRPANLEGELIHDNEPHPSASLLFGNHYWEALIDRPFKFGQLDQEKTEEHLGGTVVPVGGFEKSMKPFSMAVNNFCAETSDLFIENGFATFEASAPSTAEYQLGKEYRMRLTFENRGTMMYDRHSAFGPPVAESDVQNYQSASYETLNAAGSRATLFFQATTAASYSWSNSHADEEIGFSMTTNIGSQTNFVKTVNFRFFQGSEYTMLGKTIPQNSASFDTFSNNDIPEEIYYYMDVSNDTPGNLINDALDAWLQTGGGKTPRFAKQRTTSHGVYGFAIAQDVVGLAGNTTLPDTGPVAVWGNLFNTFGTYNDGNGNASFKYGIDDDVTQLEVPVLTTVAVTSSHGYLPYVPPFLDPGTKPYLEFAFVPTTATGGTKLYTLEEVFENLQVTSSNNITATHNHGGTNLINAMNLGASIDYNSFSVYQEDIDNLSARDREVAKRWVIQTKWETPVLDFSNAEAEVLKVSSNSTSTIKTSTSFWKERNQTDYFRLDNMPRAPLGLNYLTSSRGMWHQAGEKNIGNKGYVMTLDDVEGFESLGKKVNLLSDVASPKRSVPVGKVMPTNKTKNISEAVVAIPYYFEEGGSTRKYFNNKKDLVNTAKSLNLKLQKESNDPRYLEYYNDPGSTPVESVAYQLRMLDKYVFPPMFDILKNGEDSSFRLPYMFVFQFNAKFNQEDLTNIWQNVMPTSRESGAKSRFSYSLNDAPDTTMDTKYVSLFLDNPDNHPFKITAPKDFIEQNVRWLVFKVKQKAKVSMPQQKESSLPEAKRGSELIDSSFRVNRDDFEAIVSNGSYNWPYDYFSIVELIKIGAKTDYKN